MKPITVTETNTVSASTPVTAMWAVGVNEAGIRPVTFAIRMNMNTVKT